MPPRPGLGVSSCAASACHHGNGAAGQIGSEYTTWASTDPHARAYLVLFDERSRTIQNNLNRTEPPARRTTADQNVMCLRCHAPDGAATGEPALAKVRREDGVGCESCHGVAERWRDEHFRPERWKITDAEKALLGFRPLKNLRTRTEVCADCHVGVRGQEVDHDLIAAGHPRLQFEMSSYLAALPAHWKERGENAKPGFSTRAWAVGQVVAARADLRLLAERAADDNRIWPEFAQHDCLACHQDLAGARQRHEPAPNKRVPGTLPVNSWYISMLPALAKSTGAPDIGGFEPLIDALGQPFPDRARVTTLAESSCRQLESYQPALSQDLLLATLDRFLTPERNRTWDAVGQCFLALAAWRRSVTIGDGPGEITREDAKSVEGLLADYRAAFPAGFESPRGSPAELERQLRAVVRRLRRE